MQAALNKSRIAATGLIVGVALAISLSPTSVASQASSVRLAMVNVPDDVPAASSAGFSEADRPLR